MTTRKKLILILGIMALLVFSNMGFALFAYDSHDLQRLLATNRCPGGDLRQADLSGKNLAGANLRRANLQGANLAGTNLKKADLKGANLTNAILTNSNLNQADLKSTNLQNANLTGADLRHADLKFALLMGATLVNADLRKANLNFANLRDADLSGANLKGAILRHAILPGSTPIPTVTPIPTPTTTIIIATATPRPEITPTPEITATPSPEKTPSPAATPIRTATPFSTNNPFRTPTRRPTPTRSPSPTPAITPEPVPSLQPGLGMDCSKAVDMFSRQGLNGALIDIYNGTNFTNFVTSSTAGLLGIYNLPLDPGEYRVQVRMDNYLPINVYTKVTAGNYTYDQLLLAIPSAYAGTSVISGYVYNAETNSPVNNIQISFREGINAYIGPVVATVVTGADGYYSLELPAGNYTGELAGTGFIPDYANMACTSMQTIPGNINVSPVIPDDQLRIVLTWTKAPYSDYLYSFFNGHDTSNNEYVMTTYTSSNDLFRWDAMNYYQGPESLTILHKSQLQNGVFMVTDNYNLNRPNSMTLANSRAMVKLYQGNSLIATFNAPANQAGSLWSVFAIDQNGIIPINQIGDQGDPYNIQLHDLNGDGRPDWPRVSSSAVTVCRADGSRQTYDINAPHWQVIGYSDLDGEPGDEIIVRTDIWDGYSLWVADKVLVISDQTQSVTELTGFFNSNTSGYVWNTFNDMDGEPGNELVLEKTDGNQQQMIRIISTRTGLYRDYSPNAFGFNANSNFTYELNGVPGKELLLSSADLNSFGVYDFRNNRTTTYTIGYSSYNYTILNIDGQPGQEILINPYDTSVNDTLVICDRTQSIERFSGASFTYYGNYELDGEPGLEMLFQVRYQSPYRQYVRVISESDGSCREYDISNMSQDTYLETYTFDLDGEPGAEIVARDYVPGKLAVISCRNNTIHNYTVDYGFTWCTDGHDDTDGEPGLEIIIEADGYSGGSTEKHFIIIHDRTQTVTDYTGFGTTTPGFWLFRSADLDGVPGNELIFEKTSIDPNPYEYIVKIVSDRLNNTSEYNLSSYNPPYSLYYIQELNGHPGADLMFARYWDDGSSEFAIMNYQTNQTHYYSIPASWSFYSVWDYDGQPGAEVVFMDNVNQVFKYICDAQGIIIP